MKNFVFVLATVYACIFNATAGEIATFNNVSVYQQWDNSWADHRTLNISLVAIDNKKYLVFSLETILGYRKVNLKYTPETKNQLFALLKKSKEWMTIAIEKHLDTNKVVGCLSDNNLPCENQKNNFLKFMFLSYEKGKNTVIKVTFVDEIKHHQMFTLWDHNIRWLLDNLDYMSNKAIAEIDTQIENEKYFK